MEQEFLHLLACVQGLDVGTTVLRDPVDSRRTLQKSYSSPEEGKLRNPIISLSNLTYRGKRLADHRLGFAQSYALFRSASSVIILRFTYVLVCVRHGLALLLHQAL